VPAAVRQGFGLEAGPRIIGWMRTNRIGKKAETEAPFSYNGELARWWLKRSRESAHRRAYRNIADFIRASYPCAPEVIVDYACGSGDLLALLSRRFPHSRLVGLDGSSVLLDIAQNRFSRLPVRCSRRIRVIRTLLPFPDPEGIRANLAVFCFPNMVPCSAAAEDWRLQFPPGRNDARMARYLAPEGDEVLLWGRCISLNLRRLLVPGGVCIRVEYATARREELNPDELALVSFEEGSLDAAVDGRKSDQWFRVLASAYFRSSVLEDVYEQTGDERDRKGGYLITVLRAV
jgi:SAM-dependent methyltransferase